MLRHLRFLLACVLLAAFPLKGYTAASMLLCQPPQAADAPAAHDHDDANDHAHGHHDLLGSSADASGHSGGAPAPAAGSDGHLCGVCALCCHGLALSLVMPAAVGSPPPQTPAHAPPAPLRTRGLPVPDKPPRA